ncbi:uncharacterized protein [Ranitomeya imitator]|uniref:uncharacterized protein n=1 Tax=Ranitomeya imitator TaxID=111125 RepID=UPI0037E8E22B
MAMRMLGLMTACIPCVRWAQFHSRPLQRLILSKWDRRQSSLDNILKLTYQVRRSLLWWTNPEKLRNGVLWSTDPYVVITTDASGWGAQRQDSTGQMAFRRRSQLLQLQRTVCCLGGLEKEPSDSGESTCQDSIRQCDYGFLSEASRRSKALSTSGTGRENISLGRKIGPFHLRGSPRRLPEHHCRLPEQEKSVSNRVGTQPGYLPGFVSSLGNSQYRPFCKQEKFEGLKILLSEPAGPSGRDRRSEPGLDRTSLLCLPSSGINPCRSQEDQGRPGSSYSGCAILAEKKLVLPSGRPSSREPSRAASQDRCNPPGSGVSPKSREAPSLGLDPEGMILKARGLSSQVIATIKASRKPVTSAIYLKIWRRFCLEGGRSEIAAGTPDLPRILDFLQAGFDKGLKPSTLKVQISALSSFFDYPLASHPWIVRFIRATQRLRTTIRQLSPSWDLNLVLRFLCKDIYASADNMPISVLTRKTAFLVAITTAKRVGEIQALSTRDPYLQIRDESLILKLDPSFIPKVATLKIRNQEIVLPSFCNNPANAKERTLHSLDVRQAVLDYLAATNSWRIDPNLFILFGGRNKGKKASKASIARWITSVISEAYRSEGIPPPGGLRAHSTRGIATSWAERAGASLEQICRAATWASANTFCKHYKLDVLSGYHTAFGRKVLQSVIPP